MHRHVFLLVSFPRYFRFLLTFDPFLSVHSNRVAHFVFENDVKRSATLWNVFERRRKERMGNVGDRERFLQDQLRAAWKLKQRPTTDDRSIAIAIAIALFRSYLFTVHFQPTSFSAPCIYTSNWFTCVCVFPCTCRRLTDGDQVSPEKGNSSFSSLFSYTFLPFLFVSFRIAR